jgi:hypothetical protein
MNIYKKLFCLIHTRESKVSTKRVSLRSYFRRSVCNVLEN